jgi:MYXO-CTERM domain-containing protein
VHPGAAEFCDDVDSDCDGDLSDPESADAEIVHRDDDGDGYGNPSTATLGCVSTTWLVDGTDCDDGDRATHPGAPEVWYDGIDQNCDGLSDFDQDRDGYDTREEPGSGEDCDDLDPNVNPSVRDQPDDGIDENCDGVVASTWILGGVRGCQTGPSAPLGLWGLGLLLAWRRRQVR